MKTKILSLNRKGFTLVELLFVIGMIALLMSILIPAFNRARNGHGPVNTAPHTWVFQRYGYGNDSFADDLSAWLNAHPNYHLTTQNATDFDNNGRPQKYVVTITEDTPSSVEK